MKASLQLSRDDHTEQSLMFNDDFLKGRFHDSEHVHESKYFFSPLHAVASKQASSFNCIVGEPVGSE